MSRPRIAIQLNQLAPLSLGESVPALEAAGVDEWRVEFSDGVFHPGIEGSAVLIEALASSSKLPVTAHLRVRHPEPHLERLAKAGCRCIIVHLEACRHLHRTLDQIRGYGADAGVALCATTPLTQLEYVLPGLARITVVCNEPGPRAANITDSAPERVKILSANLRYRESRILLEASGGIDPAAAAKLSKFGAAALVLGREALPPAAPPAKAFEAFIETMAAQRHLV